MKCDATNKVLYEHLQEYPCNGYGYTVQIIEKIPSSGYVDGKPDPEITQIRQNREEFWMSTLQTVYPYGLNDRYKNVDYKERD